MGYVVTARWKARAGEGARVRGLIEQLIAPSRAEPGCRYYQPSADPDDPEAFFFFEIYDDAAAYQAHGASQHFKEIGVGQAIPLLESRERKFYETLNG